MTDEYEDDYYVGGEAVQHVWHRRYRERFSTWFGALLAVVLIVAAVVWVYRLGHRDVKAIPVIRAALEPAKVQPPKPSGTEATTETITSYSAGTEGSPPTEMTFAPPPERPAEEDVAMGALEPPKPKPEGPGTPQTAPDTGAETMAQASDTPAAAAEDEPEDVSALAPETSPVARGRPGDLAQRMEAARHAISEEAELASRAAASPVQIQLGAFPDKNQTKAEWQRIYRANEDILQGRALVMQSTISGGRRFFRLRAGPFKDRIEAQNVCRALQARGVECLVAVNG
jgi:cell division protein FtsN